MDQTIQNAGPRWIKVIAILTHCWLPHPFRLVIFSASSSELPSPRKGSLKRKQKLSNK